MHSPRDVYGTPVMLLVVLYQWIQELRSPQLDLNISEATVWRRAIALPVIVWGFWYPPYEWGVGLVFDPRELLLRAYRLMGCPTTLIPLAIMFLMYPKGNRSLFYSLTRHTVIVGLAMVGLEYVPISPSSLWV
jgi:hypothetical protein